MTSEQIAQWKVERDIARESGDESLMQRAYDHRDDMMMECIAHQSTRTKRLVTDVEDIKEKLAPCVESDREYRAAKRARGESFLSERGKLALAAGAGGGALEFALWAIDIIKAHFGG